MWISARILNKKETIFTIDLVCASLLSQRQFYNMFINRKWSDECDMSNVSIGNTAWKKLWAFKLPRFFNLSRKLCLKSFIWVVKWIWNFVIFTNWSNPRSEEQNTLIKFIDFHFQKATMFRNYLQKFIWLKCSKLNIGKLSTNILARGWMLLKNSFVSSQNISRNFKKEF